MSEDIKFTPYWWEAAPPTALKAQNVDPDCDAVIVGAG